MVCIYLRNFQKISQLRFRQYVRLEGKKMRGADVKDAVEKGDAEM